MRVAANLLFQFHEAGALLSRYEAAAKAGFRCVETAEPYSIELSELVACKERLGIEQAQINSPVGSGEADKGYACIPKFQNEFRQSIDTAILYAKALQCQKVHVLAGRCSQDVLRVQADQCYLDNLLYATRRLGNEGITCLIEPICPQIIPGYFLNNYDQAIGYLQSINAPNLKIQLDLFHAQHIAGSMAELIRKLNDRIGHVQVGQVPDRNEPDSFGELNYNYLFSLLREVGYDGFVGAEYKPKGTTVQGLRWISDMGLSF